MTRDEMKSVFKIISGIYPNFYKGAAQEEKSAALDLWAALFADEPYQLVTAAVKAFIVSDEKGFAPTPGQIKGKIGIIKQPETMTEQEAWQIVYKAICRSGYIENAREVHKNLPETIRNIVSAEQLREWALADSGSTQTVIASNFMRSFKEKKQQAERFNALPQDVRQVISKTNRNNCNLIAMATGGKE